MRRIATLGVAGCTLVVMTCWAMEVAVTCITELYPEIGARAAAIDRQRAQLESFEPRFAAIAKEVALGRTSLREASSALEQVALQHHPAYLLHIDTVESGATVHTKLAGQLLSHLRWIESKAEPYCDPVRQADLLREFEKMLADEAQP